MATDQGDVDPGTVQDRVSGLHDILIRLPGTADAARTSVLSRRWRRVWAHTPVISFDYMMPDRVDAAMAAHAAVSLSRLEIAMPSSSWPHLRMDRVAAWLLVASRRLVGDELRIGLPLCGRDERQQVLLPVCQSATSVSLDLWQRTLRFALPPAGAGAGVFKALATLTIRFALMHGRELQAAVSSSRCPCLKELAIEQFTLLQRHGSDTAWRRLSTFATQ